MMNKNAFDVVDRTLHDIVGVNNPSVGSKFFGGLTVTLSGDFRQILPVVKKGNREDTIAASLTKSQVWKHCKVYNLIENTRLQNLSNMMTWHNLRDGY